VVRESESEQPQFMSSSPARIAAVFVFCAAVALCLRLRTDTLRPGGPGWDAPADHHKYIYIAEHPLGAFHIQPPCWRIGVPALTKILPFPAYRGFDVLSVVFLGLSGGVLYLWLLSIPMEPRWAFLGVLMFFSLGGASKMMLTSGATPDPASYFFTLLALYAIYREDDFLCMIALALGVLTKETVLLVGPLHYSLRAATWWDYRRFKRCAMVCIPSICVLIAVRGLIPAWNDRDDYVRSLPLIYTQVGFGIAKYDLITAFRGTLWTYRQMTAINLLRTFTYGSLGIHFFLPFAAPQANREPLLRWSPFWVPMLASMLIAVNPDRRVSSLFPVLIVLGLNGIKVLSSALCLEVRHFQILFALLSALLLLKKDVSIVPFDLVAAVSLFWLCWAVARRPFPLSGSPDPHAISAARDKQILPEAANTR